MALAMNYSWRSAAGDQLQIAAGDQLSSDEEDGDAHSNQHTSTVRVYTGRYNRAVPWQPSCVNASWASTAQHGIDAFTLGFIFELARL